MPCMKEDMWKRVCEAWYSVALNVLEELYNSMSRRISDLIKAKGGATNYWLYDVGVQVCCCGFIEMYLSNTMLLCSHWNVFNIYTQAYKFVVVLSLKCI